MRWFCVAGGTLAVTARVPGFARQEGAIRWQEDLATAVSDTIVGKADRSQSAKAGEFILEGIKLLQEPKLERN